MNKFMVCLFRHSHEIFGDVKKLLTQEFPRQMYLAYERVPKSDPPSFTFEWGQRAKLEFSKWNSLQFMCTVSYEF